MLNDHQPTKALMAMTAKIDQLPLLPQVLVRLQQVKSDADDFFEQFESLVTEDPSLAVRVIAAANSAASGPASPIITIRDALTRIGAVTLRDLIASLAVQRVFLPTEPDQVRLWTHSIAVAVATKTLARLAPALGVNPEAAYLAGLLHDIGRFTMLEHAPSELRAVNERHWTSPEELIQADEAVYTYTHAELGALACHRWGLPESLSELVRTHHTPIESPISKGSPQATRYLVQTADRLCIHVLEDAANRTLAMNELIQTISTHCLVIVADQSYLSADQVAQHSDNILKEASALAAGLGFNY